MEPSRDQGGFAGLRVAGAVAFFSALGGIAATGAAIGLELLDARASTELQADRDARIESGNAALVALESAKTDIQAIDERMDALAKRAARAQAAELAALRTIELSRAPEEVSLASDDPSAWIFLIDAANDRIVSAGAAGFTRGSTLSAALPVVARLATKSGGTRIAEDGGFIWALGPTFHDRAIAVRVTIALPDAETAERRTRALAKATSALVNLAAAPEPLTPPRQSWWIFLAGALFGALLGGAWANRRLGRPLAQTLSAARAFVHGKNEARADERRGGRDARDVAREVNALIERADRLKAQGRAARDEDVAAVVLAIEALGRGELQTSAPAVGEALQPLAIAVEAARRDLLERIVEIHRVAVEVAASAAEVAPGAKKIASAALEELDTLRNLGAIAGNAHDEVKSAGEDLTLAVIALGEFAQAERRVLQDMRAGVRASGRRAGEIKRAAARVEALIGTQDAIEGALELLAAAADPKLAEINPASKSRISTAVGEARAAMETIGRELALLRDEMGETATGLETIAASVPESAPALENGVTATLHDTTTSLVRIVELTTGALRSLERAARSMSEGAMQIERGATVTAELAPRLGAVIAGFSLGDAFEKEILEKIERWRRDADAASKSPDGLTEDGRAILRQVVEASEAARQRLARLVSATEAAIDVLRG